MSYSPSSLTWSRTTSCEGLKSFLLRCRYFFIFIERLSVSCFGGNLYHFSDSRILSACASNIFSLAAGSTQADGFSKIGAIRKNSRHLIVLYSRIVVMRLSK